MSLASKELEYSMRCIAKFEKLLKEERISADKYAQVQVYWTAARKWLRIVATNIITAGTSPLSEPQNVVVPILYHDLKLLYPPVWEFQGYSELLPDIKPRSAEYVRRKTPVKCLGPNDVGEHGSYTMEDIDD